MGPRDEDCYQSLSRGPCDDESHEEYCHVTISQTDEAFT